MAAGAPDEKFQKLREENERRRKKKEEEEKRRKQGDEQQAKEALERRRQERLEQDERMRKPWQQPPAPKKPILRKGAKQKPTQPGSPAVDPVRQSQAEEKRKELRQGLQDFIRQQRHAAKTPTGAAGGGGGGGQAAGGGPVVPLTWEELRMAAEAGFDELLRQQELEAEQQEPQSRATRHRSPYKGPFRAAPAPPQETVQVALVPTQPYPPLPVPAAPPPQLPPGGSTRLGGPGAAAAANPAAAAQQPHDYRVSDAPGPGPTAPVWPPPQQQADGAYGGRDAAPAAVLYPPRPGAMCERGNSWADGGSGAAGDGAAAEGFSGGGGESIASSGGLRRGVTGVARHRATPLDPASLDLGSDPSASAPDEVGGARSPRSPGQRLPLPGPYDSPSQQQWPDCPQQQQQPHQVHPAAQRPAGAPAPAVQRPAVPDDPLEASLAAGGTLEALQREDGFRLASPRPVGQPQQQLHEQERRGHQQQQQFRQAQPHAEPAQQQQQAAGHEQRHARRGWGVPAQQPTRHVADPYPDPAPPPWAVSHADASSLRPPPPGDTGHSAGSGAAGTAQCGGAAMQVPATVPSPAIVRHSIGVGESGGPEMWQRDSAMAQQPSRAPVGAECRGGPGDGYGMQYSSYDEAEPQSAANGQAAPQQLQDGTQGGTSWTPQRRMGSYAPPLDQSVDLVRFSSPPGLTACGGAVEVAASPDAMTLGPQSRQAQEPHRGQDLQREQQSRNAGGSTAALVPPYTHTIPPVAQPRSAAAEDTGRMPPEIASNAAPSGAMASPPLEPGPAAPRAAAASTGPRDSVSSIRQPYGKSLACSTDFHGPQSPQPTCQQQQHSLLYPPVPLPARPPSSSGLPPLPSGHHAAAVPPAPPLLQLTESGPSQPTAVASRLQPPLPQQHIPPAQVQPQQLPHVPPQQPPMRAPSPPASPPRVATPHRLRRQLSASAAPAAGPASMAAAATTGEAKEPPPRPLSADAADRQPAAIAAAAAVLAAAADVVVPNRELPSFPAPSQHLPQTPAAPQSLNVVPEPVSLPPAAAAVAGAGATSSPGPRMHGVVAATPASPSRCAGPPPPLAPPAVIASVVPAADAGVKASVPLATAGYGGKCEPPVVAEEPSEEEVAPAVGRPAQQRLHTVSSSAEGGGGAVHPAYAREAGARGEAEEPGTALLDEDVEAAAASAEEEEVEVEVVAGGSGGIALPVRPGSGGLGSSLGRPPSTAGGSVLSGSHISARPGSGSASASARPGSGQGQPWGSGYQASLLDDSVSSFDFRARSAGASRPTTAAAPPAWAPPPVSPSRPPQEAQIQPLLLREAQQQEQAVTGFPPVAAWQGQDPRTVHGSGQGQAQRPVRSHVPATNAFEVLQPPAGVNGGGRNMYGSAGGDGDDTGDGQPFVEEPVVESEPSAASAAAAHTAAPAAVPAAAEPDLDDLMREIQALSALRRALKAEFEVMGRGEAVAALGTLSGNFAPVAPEAPPVAAVDAEEGGVEHGNVVQAPPQQPQAQAAALRQQQPQQLPQAAPAPVMAPPVPAPAPAAPVAATPLLQWNLPGRAAAGSAAAAATPQPTAPAAAPQRPLMAQPQPQVAVEQRPAPHTAQPAQPEQLPKQQLQQPMQQYQGQPMMLQQQQPNAMAPLPVSQPYQQQQQQHAYPQLQQQQHAYPQLQHPPLPSAGTQSLIGLEKAVPVATLGPSAAGTFPDAAPPPLPSSAAGAGYSQGPFPGPCAAAEEPRISSFAFAPPAGAASACAAGSLPLGSMLPPPLPAGPVALPVAAPPVQPAGLQWTIPASGAGPAVSDPAPQRAASRSGGGGAAAARTATTPTKPSHAPSRQASGGGYAAPSAVESPAGADPRSASRGRAPPHVTGTAAATATGGGRSGASGPGGGGGSGATPAERPLLHEGSYVQAAAQARERAERERAAREALQAESAAAKAAALNRTRSDRTAAAAASPGAPSASSGAARDAGPLGPKAPSSIGSYVRQPSPSPARPPARSSSTCRGEVAAPQEAAQQPAAQQPQHQAWGTPTRTRPSRIPTPPLFQDASSAGATAAARAANGGSAAVPPAREDSYDSDLDFLERASFASETTEPTESPSPPPPPRREAFASPPPASAAAASSAAYRERLAEARPRPLRIPASGAATPMGGGSTASTAASHAVPTGGARGPAGGTSGAGAARGVAGTGGAGGGGGGKASTPFTAAIRELMGLPGSAPLEQSRAAAAGSRLPEGRGGGLLPGSGGQQQVGGPRRLSEEESQLLASLQRLDAEVLRRGLTAAGLINQPPTAQNSSSSAAPSAAAVPRAAAGGKARPGAGGGGGGGGGRGGPLTNSVQQDQLRESLEKLDGRLGALRRKMEDRACMLGMPSYAAAAPGAPSAATAAAPKAAAGGTSKRDATPQREERRGPPAALAKSRTPTPNKAKAIRDQRQQQLGAVQGPPPPPSRVPAAAAAPPKPASAPVLGSPGAGGMAAPALHLDMSMMPPQQQYAPAGGWYGNGGGVPPAGTGAQPTGMPPRPPAPAARAPASAPSGPSAANAAAQQQQQQQQQQQMLYMPGAPQGVMPGGPVQALNFPGMQPGGAMSMYGMPPQLPAPQAAGGQQVAYVAAVLPNGQVAYVPQYVPSSNPPGGPAGAFPGFMQGPQAAMQHQQQQQQYMGVQMQPGPQQHPYPQQGGPMLAWGAAPQAPMPQQQPSGPAGPSGMPYSNAGAVQHHGGGSSGGGSTSGGVSLYSFERTAAAGHGMSGMSPYVAAQDAVSSSGGGGHSSSGGGGYGMAAQQQQQQQLPYATGPPPSGPLPHYQSSVMRTRSIGGREGEAVVAAAAAAGVIPSHHLHGQQHHYQQQQQQQQQQLQYQHQHQPMYDDHQFAVPQPPAPQQYHQQQQYHQPQQPQPHPVQVQSFGPNGSTRGVAGANGWVAGAGGGGGGGGGGAPEGGVIKAVNLGLLLS